MRMKLSFNNWVYSSFPVWVPAYTLEETIKRIARIGYDAIEIGAAAPHAFPAYMGKERRKAIKKVLDDNGLAVSSMLPAPGGGPGFNVSSPLMWRVGRFSGRRGPKLGIGVLRRSRRSPRRRRIAGWRLRLSLRLPTATWWRVAITQSSSWSRSERRTLA